MARNRNCLYEEYVWEVPVRVTHWVNMLAIVVLSVTGIYIGSPKTMGLSASDYVMGWVRVIHFTAGYTFATSVASRIWWAFAGNRHAGWREFVPFLYPEGAGTCGGCSPTTPSSPGRFRTPSATMPWRAPPTFWSSCST
ncbi:cytochrome b/b6 domain-containing protein [Geobacter anodireducens]